MNAAVVYDFGKPPLFQSFPEPEPQPVEALIRVRAAGLHPLVKAIASGKHYAAGADLPIVPGVDGVGTLPDGRRVYFAFPRRPWGSMGELSVAPLAQCLPVPEELDDVQAAALANPGMSAWLSIKERAVLAAGETVLILGATGVAGHLAIQVARALGAKRIIAAGRNVDVLAGESVDAVVGLAQEEDVVREALIAEVGKGVDVVIDYLWGRPAELGFEALAKGYNPTATRQTRWVQVGSSAGAAITLSGATLRSIDLKILGSGFGAVPMAGVLDAIPNLFAMAVRGAIHVDADALPLASVEESWTRAEKARRVVFTL